ncbi:MAG: MlaD family protein [Treponema sp.]|nr:MlaD family protein [Treponema sp.]
MKFSIRYADQVVGVLVILGLAILVAVVFLLGSTQRWFARDFNYITYFNSAAGLSPNMAVQYKGFTMGRVKKIMLTEADSVEVIFTIFEEYNHRVKEGSIVEVNVSPIGLGSSFVFHPGKGGVLQEKASKDPQDWPVIPEINSLKAREYIRTGLASRPESSDSISNIINQVNMLLETINVALAGSEGAESLALGQILINLEEVTAGITELVQSISVQISPILANIEMLTDDLSVQISPILANIELLSNDLSLQLNPLLAQVNPILENIETLTGELSTQINPLLAQVSPILGNVDTLLGDLSTQISPILSNIETLTGDLSEQINPILANVETLTDGLSSQINPILTGVDTLIGDLSSQIGPILSNVVTLTDQLAEPSGTIMSILDSEGPVYTDLVGLLDSISGILGSLDNVVEFIPGQLPQIALILSNVRTALVEAEKLIVSLTNNPLFKGGVPEIKETGPGAATPRNLEF